MGYKLLDSGAIVPCSISNGFLNVRIAGDIVRVKFPYKTTVFEEQQNFFELGGIKAFLKNDKYVCVVWEHGECSLIRKFDGILYSNFKLDLSPIPKYRMAAVAGGLFVEGQQDRAVVFLAEPDGEGSWDSVLYASAYPVSLVVNKQVNPILFRCIYKDTGCISTVFKFTKDKQEMLFMHGEPTPVQISGNLAYADRFIYLGGGA